MTYAFVQDTAASWEHYQRFVAGLSDPMPQGLIVHLAGPTDEGFRVIAVWDSEHDFKRFQAKQPADQLGRGQLTHAVAPVALARSTTAGTSRPVAS